MFVLVMYQYAQGEYAPPTIVDKALGVQYSIDIPIRKFRL